MLRSFDDVGRFVSRGVYVAWDTGETWGVFPDDPDCKFDDVGNALVRGKWSQRHGFVMCALRRDDLTPHVVSASCFPHKSVRKNACVTAGGEAKLGFVCWYVKRSSACIARFVQFGDPRLNGSPVVVHKTGELVGMYSVRSWLENTQAECVPCDLFARDAADAREAADPHDLDVAREVAEGWGAADPGGGERATRALEINGELMFAETFDAKAKWAAHLSAREFVFESECRYLRDPFSRVVDQLERGARALTWEDGRTIRVESVAAHGFALRPLPTRKEEEDALIGPLTYRCVNWY